MWFYIFYLSLLIVLAYVYIYFLKKVKEKNINFNHKKIYMRQIDGFLNNPDFKVFEIKVDGEVDLSSLQILINDSILDKRFYTFSCNSESLFLTFYFYRTGKYISGDKISIKYTINNYENLNIFNKKSKRNILLECFENDWQFYYTYKSFFN